jgi:hypothetical protein
MPTVWARTLRRAAELIGGELALAAKLTVKPSDLTAWLGAEGKPPPEVFLKAVDIIGEHDLREMAKRGKPGAPGSSKSNIGP